MIPYYSWVRQHVRPEEEALPPPSYNWDQHHVHPARGTHHHHLIKEIGTMSVLQGATTIYGSSCSGDRHHVHPAGDAPPCYSSDLHHVCPAGVHHHHHFVVKIIHHVCSAVGHHHPHLVMDIRQQVPPAGGFLRHHHHNQNPLSLLSAKILVISCNSHVNHLY